MISFSIFSKVQIFLCYLWIIASLFYVVLWLLHFSDNVPKANSKFIWGIYSHKNVLAYQLINPVFYFSFLHHLSLQEYRDKGLDEKSSSSSLIWLNKCVWSQPSLPFSCQLRLYIHIVFLILYIFYIRAYMEAIHSIIFLVLSNTLLHLRKSVCLLSLRVQIQLKTGAFV